MTPSDLAQLHQLVAQPRISIRLRFVPVAGSIHASSLQALRSIR